MAREVAATLNNRSFVVAAVAGMFIAVAMGLKNGLELYFALYFFQLTQAQLSILTALGVAASVAGVMLAPRAGAMFGKKQAAIALFTGALATGITPLTITLMGIAPPPGRTRCSTSSSWRPSSTAPWPWPPGCCCPR